MTELERSARAIFDGVVADCDPVEAFERIVSTAPGQWVVDGESIDLADVDDVRIIAMGKPSAGLVRACARALDAANVPVARRRGIVACHRNDVERLTTDFGSWLDVAGGGHPIPDAESFRLGRSMLDLVSTPATHRAIVVALVGGGGSTMAEWPVGSSTSVEACARTHDRLVRADLSIREINAIRKRLSAIKGGRLALAARPARVVTFVVSDVVPGDRGSVASGPTIEDDTTRNEAISALARMNARNPLRSEVDLVDPPAWTDEDRGRVKSFVVLDCETAASAVARHAAKFADVVVNLGVVDGTMESVVRTHLDRLDAVTAAHRGSRCAIVSSGEATLHVRSSGIGGRNQHFVVRALVESVDRLGELADFAILSAGTDGLDGNSPAAGGVVTRNMLDVAKTRGMDPVAALAAFDSATFLEPLGAQVITGPTGTNVRDVRILIGLRR